MAPGFSFGSTPQGGSDGRQVSRREGRRAVCQGSGKGDPPQRPGGYSLARRCHARHSSERFGAWRKIAKLARPQRSQVGTTRPINNVGLTDEVRALFEALHVGGDEAGAVFEILEGHDLVRGGDVEGGGGDEARGYSLAGGMYRN